MTDGIDGIVGEISSDGHSHTEVELSDIFLVSRQSKLEGIKETEVNSTIEEGTNTGDDEAPIETSNTVRGEGLLVHIHDSIKLLFSSLLGVFDIVTKSDPGVFEGVSEQEDR